MLEVDEGYLGRLIERRRPGWSSCSTCRGTSWTGSPRCGCWSTGGGRPWPGCLPVRLRRAHGTVVVANADDPMVVWAALAAPEVRWVGAGQVWHNDAVGCPSCGGGIDFDAPGAGPATGAASPDPSATPGSRALTW